MACSHIIVTVYNLKGTAKKQSLLNYLVLRINAVRSYSFLPV